MRWIALGCGLALGCGQFFLLKAILALALAGPQADQRPNGRAPQAAPSRRLPLLLAGKLAVYLAAALAAVWLLEDALLYAGIVLVVGLVGLAFFWGWRGLRRAAAAADAVEAVVNDATAGGAAKAAAQAGAAGTAESAPAKGPAAKAPRTKAAGAATAAKAPKAPAATGGAEQERGEKQ